MASVTEQSFGAKLSKAQELASFLATFPTYSPPRQEETAQQFQTFITNLKQSTDLITTAYKEYKKVVDQRQYYYRESDQSITKILPQIKGVIEAQFGKKSSESATVNAIITEMRATKVIKVPAVQSLEKDTIKAESTFSQSQQSYGSQIDFFNRIVTTLEGIKEYNPANDNIKVESLRNFATLVYDTNIAVTTKLKPLKDAQMNRAKAHTDLQDRMQRIKQSVKAQYGIKSNEYLMIKGL